MLIHWNRSGVDQALASVGNYEAALVFPLLLATVASMVARMMLPHHARDWELGRHQQVRDSLNRSLQGIALALAACGSAMKWLGPTIFQWAFRGQYAAAQDVLCWAILFCAWSALSTVVMNYLWCVEKTPWGALAMAAGLVVNVVLNMWLVPQFGIQGAAQATAAVHMTQLMLLLWLSHRFGMRWQTETILCCCLPLVVMA